MTLVLQSNTEPGEGDCWAACLATILDKSLADVPNFCGTMGDEWWSETQAWLAGQGLYGLEIDLEQTCGPWLKPVPPAPCIITGKSPRGGYLHAVVGKVADTIEFLHDPHPSGDFLDGPPKYLFFLGWLSRTREVAA